MGRMSHPPAGLGACRSRLEARVLTPRRPRMAQMKRSARARGGGKLALFEVIQAAQGDGQLSEAVAPMVQAIAAREAPPEPVAAPPAAARPAAVPARPQAAPPVRSSPSRGDKQLQRNASGLLGLATAFAALVALASAGYIAFQHYARGPAPVVSGSQPMPQVLDVSDGGASSQVLARPAENRQTEARPQAVAVVPDGFRRTNGLNYVLVQSYDKSERAQAEATRDALLAAGIGATIESDIPNWGKRLCVFGTEGFEQKSDPACKEYVRQLEDLSRKLTATNRRIRRFEPM